VFRVDIIFKIDGTIIVGIIVVDNFNRDRVNVVTIPGSITGWDIEWTITMDVWVSFWAVFISPSVFTIDNALVDFTRVDGSVVVIITIFNKDIIMIGFDIIFKIDRSIIVGIIVVQNVSGDISDIFTVPFSFTGFSNSEWTFTIDVFRIWAVFISPIIFALDNA